MTHTLYIFSSVTLSVIHVFIFIPFQEMSKKKKFFKSAFKQNTMKSTGNDEGDVVEKTNG
jgi:hypothetical protein